MAQQFILTAGSGREREEVRDSRMHVTLRLEGSMPASVGVLASSTTFHDTT